MTIKYMDKTPTGAEPLRGGARCQSCGMTLAIGFYAMNQDGSVNSEYCKLCMENGEFREPNLTLEEMIGRSAANMIDDQDMEEKEAEELARNVIPNLKRWKKGD